MSGINDGQRVNADNSNAAWLAKNGDDTAVGKITLSNGDVASGASVPNVQGAINNVKTFTGQTNTLDTTPTYSSTNYVSGSLENAIGQLDSRAKTNADNIATNTSNISSISTSLSTLQNRATDGYETTNGNQTLTVSSKYQQFMTSSSASTIQMPVASTLTVGWAVLVRNTGTNVVTVNSSGGSTIGIIQPNGTMLVTCILASGTTEASWKYWHLPPESNSTSTATAAGTTTLTFNSTKLQIFTGTTTQTVVLPATTTSFNGTRNYIGDSFTIINNSTGTLTVNANNAALVKTLTAGQNAQFVVVATGGTTPSDWEVFELTGYAGATTFQDSTFEIFDNSDNTKKFKFEASSITTGTTRTITVPDATDTLALLGNTQTFTGAKTFTGTVVLPRVPVVACAVGNPASATAGNPIIFPTERVDTHSAYDNTTGRFTVPTGEGGNYRLSITSTDAGTTALSVFWYKNANIQDAMFSVNTTNLGNSGYIIVPLVAGDIVDFRPNVTYDISNGIVTFERIGGYT